MTPFRLTHSQAASSVLVVSDKTGHPLAEGPAFNCYSGFDESVYPTPDDEARWERLFHHASWLGTNLIRYGQNTAFIPDTQDHFLPSHPSFRQLQWVNAWAENRDVNLIPDPFSRLNPSTFPIGKEPLGRGANRPPSPERRCATSMVTSPASLSLTSVTWYGTWAATGFAGSKSSATLSDDRWKPTARRSVPGRLILKNGCLR